MYFEKSFLLFEIAILKYFLEGAILKCIFWVGNFENNLFERTILKMYLKVIIIIIIIKYF